MKKIILSVISIIIVLFPLIVFAAVNSTGQSVMWARTGSRNASLDIDAVFFNPAGTTRLKDGLHIYYSHVMMIGHGKIENNTKFQSDPLVLPQGIEPLRDEYPIWSINFYWLNIFIDYKKGPYSIFFAFEPVGGCGGGEYPYGTPAEHIGLAIIALSATGTYDGMKINKMESKGGGGFLSPAIGAAYAINEYFAFAGEIRYIYGFMRAEGHYDVTFYRDGGGTEHYKRDVKFGYNGEGWGAGGGISITPTGENDLSIGIAFDYFSKMSGCKLEFYSKDRIDSPEMEPGTDMYQQVPSRLGVGIGYVFSPEISASISYDQSFDKYADMYGDKPSQYEKMMGEKGTEHGFKTEIAAAIEYTFAEKLITSIGYGYGTTAYKPEHQSDNTQETDRQRFHTGATYKITDDTDIHFGYTAYVGFPTKGEKDVFGDLGIYGQSTYYRYLHWIVLGFNSRFL